jgi:hypothetical protein
MTERRYAQITNNAGGVMTDEVGVITGDLTLSTEMDERGAVVLRVQYTGADEWYTVSNATVQLSDPQELDTVHQLAAALLNRPEG